MGRLLAYLLSTTLLTGSRTFAQSPVASAAPAQTPATSDPIVTFYAGGYLGASFAFGSKHDLFDGYVFEQNSPLMYLRWPGFVTLRFAPGVHTFTATLSKKHPAYKSQSTLLLEVGKQYYLRVEKEDPLLETIPVPVPPVGAAIPNPAARYWGRIDIRDCATAQKELGLHRQLPDRYIVKPFLPLIVPDHPTCPVQIPMNVP